MRPTRRSWETYLRLIIDLNLVLTQYCRGWTVPSPKAKVADVEGRLSWRSTELLVNILAILGDAASGAVTSASEYP